MANIIKIKRSTTADSPGSLSQGELAYSEKSDTLFIGVVNGGSPGLDAIGGEGHYLTKSTNQGTLANPLTGIKYFSIDALKITGGTAGKFIKTTGDGNLAWADTSVDAYSRIQGTDPSTIKYASGDTTLRFLTNNTAISFNVADDTLYDSVTLNVSDAAIGTKGIVDLTNTIDNTENKAATPKAVNTVKSTADAALSRLGGTMTGFVILNADPTDPDHAATKRYVDSVATGLDVKASVKAATVSALPGTPVYTNSPNYNAITNPADAGVGAKLTGGSGVTLGNIDGQSISVGDRLLVKNQTGANAIQNGIYTVTSLGASGGNGYVLTRATDADHDAEVTPGLFVFVEQGTVNADNGFVLNTDGAIAVGFTNLNFTQFSGAGKISVRTSTGIDKEGDELKITTIPPGNGGTGVTTYSAGDILYASSAVPTATTLARLTIGANGTVLTSTGTAPGWGKINLASSNTVDGVLGAANGGTGVNSLGTGVSTFLQTPNATNLFAALPASSKTGTSGSAVVFATSPTLVSPVIGAATGTSLTTTGSLTTRAAATTDGIVISSRVGTGSNTRNVTITTPASALTDNRTLTLADGDTTLVSGTMVAAGGGLSQFTAAGSTSADLASVISDETGFATGAVVVFNDNPSFKTGVSVASGTTTFEVFNANAQKIEAFGAADEINIGHNSGTGFTMIRNKLRVKNATAGGATFNLGTGAVDPTNPVAGDVWYNGGQIKFHSGGSKALTLINDDSTIDGGTFT